MVQRKFTFAKLFAVVLMAVIGAVCCLTACGTQFNVTWNVDENATVTVEGKNELPATAGEGEEIVFTVTPKAGYEVDDVKFNSATISPSGEKYTVKVEKDSTIDVTVKEKVEAIEVTKKPSKLTYFQGEALDKTGMEVAIKYATGRSEPITNYYIVYQGGNSATAFGLGDTSFQVRYAGKASDPVTLDSAVLAQVKINLDNATVDEAYMTALKGNSELANVTNEGGVISFTYAKELTKAIALPTGEQLLKGSEGDYNFLGWSDGAAEVTEIAAGSKESLNIQAAFEANLLILSRVYLEMDQNVPYLVIEGTFKAAESAYLYLYEGNKLIAEQGDEVSGKKYEAFKLRYDMRKLAEKGEDWKGAWMDVGFRAPNGDQLESQAIDVNSYPASFVDLDQTLISDGYLFSFKTWEGGWKNSSGVEIQGNWLKLTFSDAPIYSYEFKASEVGADDSFTLTFTGKVTDPQYYGQNVYLDFTGGIGVSGLGPIGQDGSWSIELKIDNSCSLGANSYMHFHIEDAEGVETYRDGEEGNLNNSCCNNSDLQKYGTFGDLTGASLRVANADETRVFYVGKGKWGGFIMYGVNERYNITILGDVALKVDNMTNATKVYYVVTAQIKGYTEDEIRAFKFGNIDGGTATLFECEKLDTVSAGVYRMWFNITEYSGGQLWCNIYNGETADTKLIEIKDADHSVDGLFAIVSGKKYVIHCASGSPYWDGPCVVPEEAGAGEQNPTSADPSKFDEVALPFDPTSVSIKPTEVDLVLENDKVYYIVTITVTGTVSDAQLKQFMDFIIYGDKGKFEYSVAKYEAVSGGYKLYFDVTNAPSSAGGEWVWSHIYYNGNGFDGSGGDIKVSADKNGKSVTLGGKTYSLKNQDGGDGNTWGITVLITKEG